MSSPLFKARLGPWQRSEDRLTRYPAPAQFLDKRLRAAFRAVDVRHPRGATAGTIYGITHKTTIYLPDALKAAVEREARRRGSSEAQVIRDAIAAMVARPEPTVGFIEGEPVVERADELLAGFGER